MRYKVDFHSATGTRSDDDFIGIFDTIEKANEAKQEYIDFYMGESMEEYCEENLCTEEEYYDDLTSISESIAIEPIQ